MSRRRVPIVLLLAICCYFTAHAREEVCSPWRGGIAIRSRTERRCLELFLTGNRCSKDMQWFEAKLRKRTPEELFPAAYGLQAYYGDDDNVDALQASASVKEAMNVAATAVVIHLNYFDQDGNFFTLKEDVLTLAEHGVCCGEHRRNEIAVAQCTAFLIAPDTVVTARHCVEDPVVSRKLRYVFGFVKDPNGNVPRRFEKNVTFFDAFPPRISCEDERGIDWAVLKLKHPVPDSIRPVELGPGTPNVGDAVYMVSSPLGVPLQLADNANVRRNSDHGFFRTNLDGFTCSSGAPVFNRTTDRVEGVYVRGEVDTLEICGCTKASVCPDDGCRGEDVTRIFHVPRSITDPPTDCEGIPERFVPR